MRSMVILTVSLLFFPLLTFNTYCADAYYIDNKNVFLLYKLINWWNQSSGEDAVRLCNKPVKCIRKGNTHIDYNAPERLLILNITDGFADMLSALKSCNRCFGPSFLACTWLNKKYFGKGAAATIRSDIPAISTLIFSKVEKKTMQRIKAIEKDIEIVLEGVIGGLLKDNGRIALHPAGDFLKPCPKISENKEAHFPIALKIIHSRTGEELAIYKAVWVKR